MAKKRKPVVMSDIGPDVSGKPVSEHRLTVGTEFDPRQTLTMSAAQYAFWCERRLLYLEAQR